MLTSFQDSMVHCGNFTQFNVKWEQDICMWNELDLTLVLDNIRDTAMPGDICLQIRYK